MIVMKFGGTSVADASALTSVITIVTDTVAKGNKVVVVLSATSGTTTQLLDLARQAVTDGNNVIDSCSAITERHINICKELLNPSDTACEHVVAIGKELTQYLEGIHLLKECTNQSLDKIASFGERFTTCILSHALVARSEQCSLFDASLVIRTDSNFHRATVDFSETRRLCNTQLKPLFDSNDIIVTQGYIGSTVDGTTTTLGRGGSDYSAAILGSALGAESIQIWTDVSGIYTTDPRLAPHARPILSMSFAEVRELALYGAKVLHPDTIAPAIEAGIPVTVLNTFRPTDVGTVITQHEVAHSGLHAISVVKDCYFIRGQSSRLKHVLSPDNISSKILLESHSIDQSSVVLSSPSEAAKTEIEVALAGTLLFAEPASIIVATGPGALNAEVLTSISANCTGLEIFELCSGINTLSVFIVCRPEAAKQLLTTLHDSIIL